MDKNNIFTVALSIGVSLFFSFYFTLWLHSEKTEPRLERIEESLNLTTDQQ